MEIEVFVDNLRTKGNGEEPTVLTFSARPSEGDYVVVDLGGDDIRTYRVRRVWHHFFKPEDADWVASQGLSAGKVCMDVEEVHGISESPKVYEVELAG